MKLFIKVVSIGVFPLGFGLCIYLVRDIVHMPLLIQNHVPDALWAFAFSSTLLLTGIMQGKRVVAIFSALLVAFILEWFQQYSIGTSDPFDLLAYVIGAAGSLFISIPEHIKPYYHEK